MKYRPLAMHICLPKYVLPGPSRRLPGLDPSGSWSSYVTAYESVQRTSDIFLLPREHYYENHQTVEWAQILMSLPQADSN